MKKYICTIYENRPECCKGYPWNESNEVPKSCQFYDSENDKLIPEEATGKTQEEMEEYCLRCGGCCYCWENGKAIAACSALRVEDD